MHIFIAEYKQMDSNGHRFILGVYQHQIQALAEIDQEIVRELADIKEYYEDFAVEDGVPHEPRWYFLTEWDTLDPQNAKHSWFRNPKYQKWSTAY
jgi:hypothetical protein